jgi:enoyl-CoA hydratase/carnithine racemase
LTRQLVVTRAGSVVVLTLTRKDSHNRVTQQMVEELVEALENARRDRNVSGCVLTGHGDVFCLGGDYRGAGAATAGRMEFGRAHINVFNAMARLGKPLVAAVNGNAHAGGFSLVVACDLAFMADDATLGLPEGAHGLFPFLALALAREAIPKKLLFEIIYDARLISSAEALSLHLVNKIVPRNDVLQAAIDAVERASKGNPDVLMLGRDLYYNMRGLSSEQALDQARFALGSALSAADEPKQN